MLYFTSNLSVSLRCKVNVQKKRKEETDKMVRDFSRRK
jgi:hypothetical protein